MGDLTGEIQGLGDLSDLVLIEFTEWFDHLFELDGKGHSSDIMMTLDAPLTLDTVRVERPLEQVFRTRRLCFPLKDTDEPFSDDLAFLLRIRLACKGIEELVRCIHHPEAEVSEQLPDAGGLPLPHQTGIHVDRDEPRPNRTGCQFGTDRTVNSP